MPSRKSGPRGARFAHAWLRCLFAIVPTGACSAPSQHHCELTPPRHVASNASLGFDDIAIVATDVSRALYVWSDTSGLWVAPIDDAERPTRLGERCHGGLAALASRGEVDVACSRNAEGLDEVVLLHVDHALHAKETAKLGRAGRDGHGVAIASASDGLRVLFHDGSIGVHAIVLATVHGTAVVTQQLSNDGVIASEPSLLAHGGHVYAAFSEVAIERTGEPASSVWVSRDGQRARLVTRPRAYAPTPKLTADALGLMLSFRDRARAERLNATRNELYVARLGHDLGIVGRPRAVGRANTESEPSLQTCGALTTALLPREYGGERYVGIHALDGDLGQIGAGHQLYANGREFVQASGACLDGRWLLFAADRATPGKPGSEAVAMTFTCQ